MKLTHVRIQKQHRGRPKVASQGPHLSGENGALALHTARGRVLFHPPAGKPDLRLNTEWTWTLGLVVSF